MFIKHFLKLNFDFEGVPEIAFELGRLRIWLFAAAAVIREASSRIVGGCLAA